jgi:hypothetical protein
MRALLCLLFLTVFLLAACGEKKLVKRIPGSWYIDHYDEYAAGSSTGHALDTLVTITDARGGFVEEWLITRQLADYMEWVSVNAARDTVRTMYLKR